jgi:selT/selW/selH-like putative selenoprotein
VENELKREFPECTVELVEGSGGVFDVTLDGSMVYSKFEKGDRFPEEGEVSRLVREIT